MTAVGFASVYIARKSVVSTASLTYAGLFFGLYAVAHLVVRATVPFADPYLLPIVGLLTGVGLTEIYRLNPDDAFKQAGWIVVGVAFFTLALILLRHDYRRLEVYKYLFGITAIALLVLPVLPVIGLTVNGARLWVHFGPLRFQPGELAKVMLIVFLAGYMREKREVLAQGRLKDWGPLLVIWALAMLVLLETKDLGGGLLYFGIFLAMLYMATGESFYTLIGILLLLAGGFVVYHAFGHVQVRVDTWLRPFSEDMRFGAGYQIVQGLFALANGGLFGAGLGNGMPDRIPIVWSDFVFNAFAEETGFAGALALLALYLLFVYRGMLIALRAPTMFLQLLAAGLSFIIALQTLVIVGGNLRLIPLTGITLPFVAYGGSSLVTNWMLVAILMRVSQVSDRMRGGGRP